MQKHEPYYWDAAKKAEYEKVMRQRDNTIKFIKYFLILIMVSWIPFVLYVEREDDNLLHMVIEGDFDGAVQAINDSADIHMIIKRKFTLLQVNSFHKADIKIAKFLIEKGVPVNAVNEDGDTAYDIAIKNGYGDLAYYLKTVHQTD